MPLIETISLTLGAGIAKQIIKSWLGDSVAELSGELLDLIKGKAEFASTQRESARRIEKIGEQVAIKLYPIFEAESQKLTTSETAVVTQEVALTLLKAQIDARTVLECRFDSERLARQLIHSRPELLKTFSESETALYERFLREVCKEIIAIVSELASFDRYFSEATLQSQDQILALVEKIYMRPSKKAETFERLYCQSLVRQLDRMELFGVARMDAAAKRQSLSIAYVAIDVDQTGNKDTQLPLFESTFDESMPDAKRMSFAPQSGPIYHLLATSRKIIVRGQAGSGKSTLLQWLAVRSASHDFPVQLSHWNKTIPFFIRLRERVNKDFPNPEEFPGLIASSVAGQMPHGWVHEQLDNGRAVVLIDGVDELPSTQRPAMLEHLRQLVSNYQHSRYLITSRPAALKAELWPEWQEWIKQEGFVETSLQPMSQSHIENFIDQWHEALAKTMDEEEELNVLKPLPGNLKRQLRQRPPLRRLADNPLLCAMICALHRERNENLPAERIELYRGCVEMLLSRRDAGRKIDVKADYPELSDAQKLVFAQSFAYWLMKNGYSDVEQAEVDNHFEGKRAEMNLSDSVTGEGVRRLLMDRANLLREPIAQRVDFTHRTFQEYLAAQAAIKQNDVGVLIKHGHEDQWRETIILAAGEARPKEREKLLKGLIARADKLRTPRLRKQLYLLAVACLETCVELMADVRQLVLDKAAPLFPPQDEDDVKLMAAAGDPAVPLLVYNPEHGASEAARCVKVLAMIGSKSAMDAVVEYARHYVDRWQVRDEIGYSWGQFDRHKYAKEVLKRSSQLSLKELSSLEGFEHLSHVELLIIWKSQLTDLSPVRFFPNLTFLQLIDWDHLFDLTPLASAQNLKDLVILTCKNISDITPFARLKSLERVEFYSCPKIQDITPLIDVESLTRLAISDLPKVDIDSIKAFQNLTDLEIRHININDTRIFDSLTNLKHLALINTKLNSLNFLARLTELSGIEIFRMKLNDLSILSTLPKLKRVRVDDLSLIMHLNYLKEINIGGTKTGDIRPLLAFPTLEKLIIGNTEIIDLSPLAELSSLTSLISANTKISDLSPLKNLTKLTTLNIINTNVTDLSPLASLENLKVLYLEGTPVKDLSPVKGIKGLKIIR